MSDNLGNTWGEILGNGILLLLLLPVWIPFICLGWLMQLADKIFHFPAPENVPDVLESTAQSDVAAKAYVAKITELIDDADVTEDDFGIKITNKNAQVTVWNDYDCVGIGVEGLDTGFWHTAEEDSIDAFFWFAVAALRKGIRWKYVGLFRRKEGWVYSPEMKIWMGVSTDGDKRFSCYTKFARKF